MGDFARKDLLGSINRNNNRRSRSEIIKFALGVYLKQKNYAAADRFRRSDFSFAQSSKQFIFNKMIEEDISRANSFLYSNVLCVSNNNALVEQQFTKFVRFVQSQTKDVKDELSNLFGPLMCHLYIELLKGREWLPAWKFLRNNAHNVAPIENLNAPLPTKVNGCSVNSNSHDEASSPFPAVTTQIQFISGTTGNSVKDHFKELIQTLSTCLKIETLDSIESIALLRSSKYEIGISLTSLRTLKQYLYSYGHVILLNVLHTWIHFDITDVQSEDDQPLFNLEDFEEKPISPDEVSVKQEEVKDELDDKKPCDAFKYTVKIYTDNLINPQLRKLKHAVNNMHKTDSPIRTLNITDPNQSVTCATLDPSECHIAAGFNNSLIKLWHLNRNTKRGSSLYKKFREKLCSWDVNNLPEANNSTNESDSLDEADASLLRGHSKGVTDVLFSSHYPLLISTSKDLTMRAWKSADYSCGSVYRGHTYPIWCVSESPLGAYIATGSRDFTARLWSLERNYPLITYVGHTQDIDCTDFHPNGNYLATGSSDMSVRLWCVTSGKLFRVFTDCRLPVTCISFSPDGKLLAAAGEESKIRIFDLAAGSQLCELKDQLPYVTKIAWNAKGNKLASCCVDGSIRLWDISKIRTMDPHSSQIATCNRLLWHMSGCTRSLKIVFNSVDSLTSIGSSSYV